MLVFNNGKSIHFVLVPDQLWLQNNIATPMTLDGILWKHQPMCIAHDDFININRLLCHSDHHYYTFYTSNRLWRKNEWINGLVQKFTLIYSTLVWLYRCPVDNWKIRHIQPWLFVFGLLQICSFLSRNHSDHLIFLKFNS